MKANLSPNDVEQEAPVPVETLPGKIPPVETPEEIPPRETTPESLEEPLEEATLGNVAVVDVRSPAEFAKGAVAGAVNLPLFSDGERSEIGTLIFLPGRHGRNRSGSPGRVRAKR